MSMKSTPPYTQFLYSKTGKTNFNSFYGLVTRKLSQGHQNLINSMPPSNNALVIVWSKSIHLFGRYRVGKPNLISFHELVTLKMRPRSLKSNQLFPPSQSCIYASLVKIHPLVQKISRRKEATRTHTRTRTRSAPKTICPPPSAGGT